MPSCRQRVPVPSPGNDLPGTRWGRQSPDGGRLGTSGWAQTSTLLRGGVVVTVPGAVRLLGARDIRGIAGRLGVHPVKRLGQNFVVEQGTVRQIAALAAVRSADVILEVGPGLGSLTLALLDPFLQADARLNIPNS